jgi:predicted nucleic acid-binding protein
MTSLVLDASAALRAVMDPGRQQKLLECLAQASAIVSPALARLEIANALWKYHRTGLIDVIEMSERYGEALILIDRFIDESDFFPEVLHLPVELKHPVYDTAYLLAARRNSATLVTFDWRLHVLAGEAKIACELFEN